MLNNSGISHFTALGVIFLSVHWETRVGSLHI